MLIIAHLRRKQSLIYIISKNADSDYFPNLKQREMHIYSWFILNKQMIDFCNLKIGFLDALMQNFMMTINNNNNSYEMIWSDDVEISNDTIRYNKVQYNTIIYNQDTIPFADFNTF